MTRIIEGLIGIHDILPGKTGQWHFIESTARKVFESFGYSEIRTPIIERTELFARSIGESTDIVEKEMYTFTDKGGRSCTLRPEATAGIVRAILEHHLDSSEHTSRLYCFGPMFRYERPSKERYRQFYQIDVECFGNPGPAVDAEIIFMAMHFFKELEIRNCSPHINSLGCPECRTAFRESLSKYMSGVRERLCPDCRRRLETNPLRFFDCKNCTDLTRQAPLISEFLCAHCKEHFEGVRKYLEMLQIPYVVNPRIVRGLDYYTRTIFEIVSERLGTQKAILGGGRYDGLVAQLGGKDIPGIGFAIGTERLSYMIERPEERFESKPRIFVASLGDEAGKLGFKLANDLRTRGIQAVVNYNRASLKSQMRRAHKMDARYVLILGDNEIRSGEVVLRDMQRQSEEKIPLKGILDAVIMQCRS
ncbi:MAG: histidine--tRNA ligase [Deltaproteobacteria bacterium]|nr:histidine--tRNA ligase [Deltaproteobacteria bacterium]MBW2308043.1 histidine--tRNA ligase [Deltaproteobacteria bacterium]